MNHREWSFSRIADLVLAAATAYWLFILLWIPWRRAWHDGRTLVAAATVAVLALIALFWVWRSSRERRTNVALALTALALSAYGIELGLFAVEPSRAEVARKLGIDFDPRPWHEVLLDGKTQRDDLELITLPRSLVATEGLGEGASELFPLAGRSRVDTLFCNESGRWQIYRSDQHGFNNQPETWPAKPSTVLLGDSFTHGMCMPEGRDIAGRLRQRGLEVLNLGMANNGPLLELATLEEYAAELRPKWVIWIYFEGNDLENLVSELRSETLRRYLHEPDFSQQLSRKQNRIDALVAEYQRRALDRIRRQGEPRPRPWLDDLLDTVKLSRWRARLAPWLPMLRIGSLKNPPPEFEQILERARDRTRSWGGRLLFVYLPDYHRFRRIKSFPARDPVLATVAGLGIPDLDLVPVLAGQPDPMGLYPFGIRSHFNDSGYALVAEAIAQRIAPMR